MWGEKAASPVHAIHTFHSVGVLVAVPFTGSFLSNRNETVTPHLQTNSPIPDLYFEGLDNGSQGYNNQTMVYIPYGVIGGVGILASISFMIFHLVGWTFINLVKLETEKKEVVSSDEPNCDTDTYGSTNEEVPGPTEPILEQKPENGPCLKWTFIIGLFISYTSLMYRDAVLSTYLFPIAVKSKLQMTKKQSTYLNTGYSAAYAGGRVASIIYSKYINIHILVFLEATLVIIGSILLATLGLEGSLQLWIIVCFLGVFSAPTYPSVMSWANFYIPVSGLVVAAIDIGIGAGAFSGTWVGGYIFDHLGPIYIFYVAVAFSVTLLVILLIMQIIGYINKKRNSKDMSKDEDNSLPYDDNCDERTPLIN